MRNNQEKSSIKLPDIPTKRYFKTIMSPLKNSTNNYNILKLWVGMLEVLKKELEMSLLGI